MADWKAFSKLAPSPHTDHIYARSTTYFEFVVRLPALFCGHNRIYKSCTVREIVTGPKMPKKMSTQKLREKKIISVKMPKISVKGLKIASKISTCSEKLAPAILFRLDKYQVRPRIHIFASNLYFTGGHLLALPLLPPDFLRDRRNFTIIELLIS